MAARPFEKGRSERGAVALMVGVAMTAMCVAVAIVLDFGIVRVDRQANKAAADAASSAGIRAIEGNDGTPKPWRGVCQALRYLRANATGTELDDLAGTWRTGAGVAVAGDPCTPLSALLTATCVPGSPSSWAWYSGVAAGGRITVDIKSGYRVTDGGFPEESVLAGDAGDPAQDGCDQLAVIIQETREPGLGRLVTDDDLVSRVRSVARATIGEDGDAAVALLLLEQHDCLVVDIQGSSGARVLLRGSGERPGMLHSDSLGDGALCSGTNKIIDGDFGSPPRIWAEDAESGTPLAPGIIGIVALTEAAGAVPTNASDLAPDYVFAEGQPDGAPIGRDKVTRKPVDARYRLPVSNAIGVAKSLWDMSAATATASGWTVVGCSPGGTSTAATRVFVDCPGGASFTSSHSFTGDDAIVVFNGSLSVGGAPGTTLEFTDARAVYVKGSASNGIGVTRKLRINTGSSVSCSERFAGDRTARTHLVLGDGPFLASGGAALTMCQTSVLLADDDGTCPIPAADGSDPRDNTCVGYIDVRGNGGLDWTAPNAVGTDPTDADFAALEDLALWTETSGDPSANLINRLEGGGSINLAGVFFLPNAKPFRVAGLGVYSNNANAQFVSRRLEVAGNAQLNMRPDPDDVVTFPYFGEFTLVR